MTIYEWTGEYRPPKKGEWFLGRFGGFESSLRHATYDMSEERFILSPRQEEAKDEF